MDRLNTRQPKLTPEPVLENIMEDFCYSSPSTLREPEPPRIFPRVRRQTHHPRPRVSRPSLRRSASYTLFSFPLARTQERLAVATSRTKEPRKHPPLSRDGHATRQNKSWPASSQQQVHHFRSSAEGMDELRATARKATTAATSYDSLCLLFLPPCWRRQFPVRLTPFPRQKTARRCTRRLHPVENERKEQEGCQNGIRKLPVIAFLASHPGGGSPLAKTIGSMPAFTN